MTVVSQPAGRGGRQKLRLNIGGGFVMRSRFLLLFAILLFVCGLSVAADQASSSSTRQGAESKDDAAGAEQNRSRWPRVRLGGVVVSAGYTHFSGHPGWYGPYGYGRYGYAYGYPWYMWDSS